MTSYFLKGQPKPIHWQQWQHFLETDLLSRGEIEIANPLMGFELKTNGYNPHNALLLVKASQLAYLEPEAIKTGISEWNLPNFHFFNRRNTQAYIAGNEKVMVIAFRGTEPGNLRDWMNNTNILMKPGYGGHVHAGFHQALEDIWADIATQIGLFNYNNQAIFLTGHSLGGSLAKMTAVRLPSRYQDLIQGIYSFGSPRVGNQQFADNYNQKFRDRTFRMINHRDIVTRLAPRSFGYRHVNSSYFFDSQGILHTEIRYWRQFLETVKGTREEFINAASFVKDHDLREYEKNVLLDLNGYLAKNG